MKKIIFPILFLFSLLSLKAQQVVHWAYKVDTVTSEYSPDKYGARQVLGIPNVDTEGRKSLYAWAVEANEIDREAVEIAWIEVEFEKKYLANQIAIFESYNPGAVSLVYYSSTDNLNDWTLVFADTAVIARSGLPPFQKDDKALRDVAGTRKRKSWFFGKDKAFLPPATHRILHIFLNEPEPVKRVRVVINPLAVDGWNQIDAIGIVNSKDSIRYPKPHIVDQSLILEPNSQRLKKSINTGKAEINPVISPDGKRIYYSKRRFIERYSVWTQDIWYSDIMKQKEYACSPTRPYSFRELDVWKDGTPVYLPFNSIVPHTILGFSADGSQMYINGIYTPKDDRSVFAENTSGLSVSVVDSTLLDTVSSQMLRRIDSVQRVRFCDYVGTDTILIFRRFDTLKHKNFFYARVMKKEKDTIWSIPYLLGTLKDVPISFNVRYKGDTLHYWIHIDSLSEDNFKYYFLNWSEPEPVRIENFKNYSNYVDFFIASDGKHMFLSIQPKDSIDERDIYISELKDDGKTWSEPLPLSPVINTIGDEASPFLDGDNRTLYFSSNGHNTYGEHDVFVSYRLGDGWSEWSEPENLGPKVNTHGDDVQFAINQDSRRAYFASYEFATGCNDYSDIFSIKMAKPITIHIKGVTRNLNNNNKPLGNVKVSLKAIGENNFGDIRTISFYSSEQTGKFDVLIRKMIDANKMTTFGLYARKNNYPQGNKQRDTIEYVDIDLTNPPWEVELIQDLYLFGPKVHHFTKPKPEKQIDQDTIIDVGDITKITETKTTHDTVYIYVEKSVCGEMSLDTTKGCPVFYYAGKIYGISVPKDTTEGATIEEIDPSYVKYFKYNEKDVSLNEKDFATLWHNLLRQLGEYEMVTVYIQSSASQVPTRKYCNNFELARLRGEEVENRLKQELSKKGIDLNRVKFDKRYIVEGNYNHDPQNKKKYERYQYVRVWIYSCPYYSTN